MRIAMFTNTFTPHVGGVARAVSGLSDGLRRKGHDVLVVAPTFPGYPEEEEGVVRLPAVQHVAAARDLPIVFTYHTRYELYGHYVAQDSEVLKRLVRSLSAGYCDLCDYVIAPSESIAEILAEQGVETPVAVIPSGVDPARFAHGDAKRARAALDIPRDAFLVGHVGRLAPEKNLEYLADALALFLQQHPAAHVVVTGGGPSQAAMQRTLHRDGHQDRVHFTGVLTGAELADVYKALDVFAFSSLSETQGLVLAEAMTADAPVVALDAPGVREVVRDGVNGRLLSTDTPRSEFAEALVELSRLDAGSFASMPKSREPRPARKRAIRAMLHHLWAECTR